MKENRLMYVDIAKGIGIILVAIFYLVYIKNVIRIIMMMLQLCNT